MKKIAFILLIFAFTSCSVQKRCERLNCSKPTERILETVTNTVFRDTVITVYLPGDTIIDSIPYEVVLFKDGTVKVNSKVNHLSTSLAYSDAWIKDGLLHHTLVQRDSVLKANIENAIRITQSLMKETNTVVVKERYLTWWDKFFKQSGQIGWVLFLIICTYFGFKVADDIKSLFT